MIVVTKKVWCFATITSPGKLQLCHGTGLTSSLDGSVLLPKMAALLSKSWASVTSPNSNEVLSAFAN